MKLNNSGIGNYTHTNQGAVAPVLFYPYFVCDVDPRDVLAHSPVGFLTFTHSLTHTFTHGKEPLETEDVPGAHATVQDCCYHWARTGAGTGMASAHGHEESE